MINQVSDILESDVAEANERMLGKNADEKDEGGHEIIILLLFIILIIGIVAYIEEKRNRENNKIKFKAEDGELKEITLEVSDSEIEKALEILKST